MIINVQNTQEANYSVLTHCKCIFGGYQEYVLWATNHLWKQTNVYQLKESHTWLKDAIVGSEGWNHYEKLTTRTHTVH